MSHPDDPGDRPRPHDPHEALVSCVRWSVVPALCLPATIAMLGASATGQGLPIGLAWPVAALALTVSVAGWWKVVRMWRALPRPDDDDQGGWRWWGDRPPAGPDRGPGGIAFDWTSFERQFWAYVAGRELALA